MSRGRIITITVILAFIALLAWNTLSAQRATCEVCVEFNGQRNCARASHETEAQAAESAQQTACGPLANGMNDVIACGNRPPATRVCHTK